MSTIMDHEWDRSWDRAVARLRKAIGGGSKSAKGTARPAPPTRSAVLHALSKAAEYNTIDLPTRNMIAGKVDRGAPLTKAELVALGLSVAPLMKGREQDADPGLHRVPDAVRHTAEIHGRAEAGLSAGNADIRAVLGVRPGNAHPTGTGFEAQDHDARANVARVVDITGEDGTPDTVSVREGNPITAEGQSARGESRYMFYSRKHAQVRSCTGAELLRAASAAVQRGELAHATFNMIQSRVNHRELVPEETIARLMDAETS